MGSSVPRLPAKRFGNLGNLTSLVAKAVNSRVQDAMSGNCHPRARSTEPRSSGSGGQHRSLTVAALNGKRYWRGLEELCETAEFRDYLKREFPEQASTWTDPVTRR